MKTIKIGLLGMGNIGTGTYQALEMNHNKIIEASGISFEITRILEKDVFRKRGFEVPVSKFTQNPDDIFLDPEIQIVIELLGGVQFATDMMMRALEHGKHVVTANKAALAANGTLLRKTAIENKVMLRYEASVGGGIPIIHALTQALLANEFEEILGIVNGTTNYILTQMSEYGLDYDSVLKTAQAKGFAEADPTADVEGHDVANKLSILMSLVFGVTVPPSKIPTEGITRISKDDIDFASQFGYKIKLLATARKAGDELEGHVQPALVPVEHPLASVSNEFNAIFVRGNAVDDLMFYGKGAGPLPTASAVLGDVIEIGKDIVRGSAFDNRMITDLSHKLKFIGEGLNMYYVRLITDDVPGVLGKVSTALGDHGISIQTVMQRPKTTDSTAVPVIYIMHAVTRSRLNEALDEIAKFPFIHSIDSIIRVEGKE